MTIPGATNGERVRPLAYTKAQAAEALGVSFDFAQEHVFGELRLVRRGRRVLVPIRELERWLDENASRVLGAS